MLTGGTAVGTHIQQSARRLCSLHAWAMLSVGRWRQITRAGIGKDQLKGSQKTRRSGRATRCNAGVSARTPSQRVSPWNYGCLGQLAGKKQPPSAVASGGGLIFLYKKAAAVAVAVAVFLRSSVHQRERTYDLLPTTCCTTNTTINNTDTLFWSSYV